MRIGILGTGDVGRTLSGAFAGAGHDAVLGSRTAGDDTVRFADAVAHGELLVNATAGTRPRGDQLLDLGGVSAARGMEMYLPLWLRLMQTLGTPVFNVGISRP